MAAEGDGGSGFVAAGAADVPAESPLGAQAWGEIRTLLVEPRWGRRGHGGRLLAAAVGALLEGGALYGQVWVPEVDEASRRLDARAGWEPDGTVRGAGHGGRTCSANCASRGHST